MKKIGKRFKELWLIVWSRLANISCPFSPMKCAVVHTGDSLCQHVNLHKPNGLE